MGVAHRPQKRWVSDHSTTWRRTSRHQEPLVPEEGIELPELPDLERGRRGKVTNRSRERPRVSDLPKIVRAGVVHAEARRVVVGRQAHAVGLTANDETLGMHRETTRDATS